MESPWIAALVALFAWWFATGAILWVVRHADRTGLHRLAVLAGLPVLALGAAAFAVSARAEGVAMVYLAFGAALVLWGWAELAFLAGVITGPNTRPLRPGAPEWERFLRAWGTVAYHEMLLAAMLLGAGWVTLGAPNRFGFWTFAVLFVARISAKLNLYLGVRRINTEFLPSPLTHLPSHFRISRMNWLFPISVTALSFAVACWLERTWSAATPAEAAGFALLAALTALALLEHWLMVVPLPDAKLWRWMLPAPADKTRKDAHGL
ncbi:MAG: putative photosynthetic complex assembly protein PuhE [Rhodobacteraceae bacterium]|nr:putative photosynthetic complex assembly protein PuhE [Paracoccaceae bacterium]